MKISFTLEGAFGEKAARAIKAGATEAVRRVANEIRTAILQNLRGSPLRPRSGGLLRSWSGFPTVEETASGPQATLSSSLVYSAIHEYGGTIVPRTKAFLTIPLPGAQNASGTRTLHSAGELKSNPGLLGFKSTFINPRRTAILGVQAGGGLVPLFAIADRVEMPSRRYVSKAVDSVRPRAQKIADDAVKTTMARLGVA